MAIENEFLVIHSLFLSSLRSVALWTLCLKVLLTMNNPLNIIFTTRAVTQPAASCLLAVWDKRLRDVNLEPWESGNKVEGGRGKKKKQPGGKKNRNRSCKGSCGGMMKTRKHAKARGANENSERGDRGRQMRVIVGEEKTIKKEGREAGWKVWWECDLCLGSSVSPCEAACWVLNLRGGMEAGLESPCCTLPIRHSETWKSV